MTIESPETCGAPLRAATGSAETCQFCNAPRQLKPGCQKQRWMVCDKHFMVACPKCGHEAFWMEKMKSGRSYYACFRVDPWCNWTSETPPNAELSEPSAGK